MISLSFPCRPRGWLGALVALLATLAMTPARADIVDDAIDDGAAAASAARWEAFAVSSAKSRIAAEPHGIVVELANGDRATFSRAADMNLSAGAILCTFNVSMSGVGAERITSQAFRMGWDFSNSNNDEPDARTYAALGLVASEADAFQLRDLVGGRVGATYRGTQAVSWVVNNSGQALSYDAPNGMVERVGNDRMDVWVGRDRVFDDLLVTNPAGRITDLKWVWSRGSGRARFDRFEVRALQEASSSGASVASAQSGSEGAPQPSDGSIALERPTPNPFSRAMRFAYAIPAGRSPVDIGVFDVAGRRVRLLARGPQVAGQYEVRWDGLGDDGKRVKQGVYFLRASIGASSRVSRIVYLPN
jgi:hypothetical protein